MSVGDVLNGLSRSFETATLILRPRDFQSGDDRDQEPEIAPEEVEHSFGRQTFDTRCAEHRRCAQKNILQSKKSVGEFVSARETPRSIHCEHSVLQGTV